MSLSPYRYTVWASPAIAFGTRLCLRYPPRLQSPCSRSPTLAGTPISCSWGQVLQQRTILRKRVVEQIARSCDSEKLGGNRSTGLGGVEGTVTSEATCLLDQYVKAFAFQQIE